MISEKEITDSKQKFLGKYNKNNDTSTALQKSRNAASQRNRLYAEKLAEEKRLEVRHFWEDQLQQKYLKYKNEVPFKTFIKDVLEICKEMNKKFNSP